MIKIGTRVMVLENAGYGNKLAGMTGTVHGHFTDANKVGVMLDHVVNANSKNGLFWFDEGYVTLIPQNEMMVFDANTIIKKVIFSGPKTIVMWSDGTKTIVGCSKDDVYDPCTGFCAAVAKKVFGSTSQVKKICNTYLEEKES